MAFYDLNKTERQQLVDEINRTIFLEIEKAKSKNILNCFSDEDTRAGDEVY